jgi:hypothetical protein
MVIHWLMAINDHLQAGDLRCAAPTVCSGG